MLGLAFAILNVRHSINLEPYQKQYLISNSDGLLCRRVCHSVCPRAAVRALFGV